MANSKGITSLKLVGKPGGIVQPGIQKYGVWDWVETAVEYGKKGYDWYKNNKDVVDTIAKTATSLGKGYLDYKDAKRRSELEERAYEDYMREAEAAGYEAQAAIDLNLTPMLVSNIPTTKADVTDYTAATGLKHGGISGLRKKYARGPGEDEVLEMDEEVITPFDLQKEEGVNIGEQVFYNTGRGDRANAMMIWEQMSTPDKSIFDFDFELFFQDGSWRDWIKGEAPSVEEDTMMASAPSIADSQNEAAMQLFNKPYDQLNEMELQMFQEEMSKYMAKGGIAGLRKKYSMGTDEIEIEEMDEELVTPFELQKEEGVPIGPMAGPDWYIKRIEHLEFLGYSYEEASEIAFDNDRYYEIVGMESAIPRGGDPEQPPIYLPKPGEDSKGIMAAAKGGRARYDSGTNWIVKKSDVAKPNMGPTEGINRKKPDFFEDLFLKRTGGGGQDYIVPAEASERTFNEIFTLGDNDMAKAEKIESERSIQGLYNQAIRILDKAWDIDEDLHEEINQTFIDAANNPDVSPANAYYTIIKKYGDLLEMKKGGRARKANGGIMDMGGLEKDYRFSGGFVPIGEYEKKDDVPARLSKNEFVFTADAVRAAGGGSINKGAKRMYETMKNLEARPEAKRMTA